MTQLRIAILSSQSLLAEGLAARLRLQLDKHELLVVDARQADALQQLISAQPMAVIIDGTDADLENHCPLNNLLNALPTVTIVRVTAEQPQVQVITSEQRALAGVSELMDVLKGLPAGS